MPEAAAAPPPAPPPPAPPPAANWYDGKAAPEMLGFWQNKGYNAADPATVAIEATKAAMQAQTFIGAPPDQLIKLPKDANDEAGWKGVYSRLGVPAEAKDYDLSSIKTADGKDLDPAFADMMRAALHRGNVGKDKAPEVVKALVKHFTDREAARATETAAQRAAERAQLLKDWGNNAEFNRLTAMQGAKRLGVTEEDVARFENILGYNKTMEMFRKVGAGTTEDTFVESKQGGPVTTAGTAAARKTELMADKAWVERYLNNGTAERNEMAAINALITEAA
jgi:hypothetical protein